MRSRSFLLVGFLLAVVLAGAGVVYAYDESRKDKIAEGVTVNGVDVGGLTGEQARAKLRAALLEPLDRPVTARYRGRRFRLTPEQASIGVDIDGSVDDALARSQEGSMFSRSWRNVRGAQIDAAFDAEVTWSRAAVQRLVKRVADRVYVAPRDAELDLSQGQIDPEPSRNGREVDTAQLRRELERELLDGSDRRSVRVRTETLKPKVTTDQLAEKYPAVIIVSRGSFQLSFYKNLELAKTYTIAVGQAGYDTPTGLYNIQNKAVNPAWSVPDAEWAGDLAGTVVASDDPANPIKARWMGIYDGAGIHGTDAIGSLGSAASHGCIRMSIPEVEELYDQVPVGAPVYIA